MNAILAGRMIGWAVAAAACVASAILTASRRNACDTVHQVTTLYLAALVVAIVPCLQAAVIDKIADRCGPRTFAVPLAIAGASIVAAFLLVGTFAAWWR